MTAIARARILILATDGFEQSELETPLHRLREAGASVDVVTTDGEGIRGFQRRRMGRYRSGRHVAVRRKP